MTTQAIYRVEKYETGQKVGVVGLANDANAVYLDSEHGAVEFMVKADAIKVADFKNWYAAHHSLPVEYKVFERSVIETEIVLAKVDYLADRPKVEIEDADRTTESPRKPAQPSVSPKDKAILDKQRGAQVDVDIEIEE